MNPLSHVTVLRRGIALLAIACATSWLQAMVIDRHITILPIQVRSDNGGPTISNPTWELFAAATDKIWAQAGIDVQFEPWIAWNNSLFLNISAAESGDSSLSLLSQMGDQPWSIQGESDNVVRLFLVQEIAGDDEGNLGLARQSLYYNYDGPQPTQRKVMCITDAALTSGRIDIVAHELGHLLALAHAGHGMDPNTASDAHRRNLMADGNSRLPAYSIDDIFPDGLSDQLTLSINGLDWANFQIDQARAMPIAAPIPEPSTGAMALGTAALVAGAAWRIRSRR